MRTNEELIRDYRAGEADAMNELAKQNRGLISRVARQWCKRRRYWDDTFQECSLVFLMAAGSFDLSKKTKFSGYAYTAMDRHMKNLVVYRSAQKRTAKVVRLHDGMKDHKQSPAMLAEIKLDSQSYLSQIPKARTRKVVWLRMQGYTFPEIGRRFGVSLERARQIVIEGMQTLGCYD